MAVKTGTSHALATLLLTLLSALLIHFLRDVGVFEKIFNFLLQISYNFSQWLENSTNITVSHEIIPVLFVATVLAFVWGMVFHLIRK